MFKYLLYLNLLVIWVDANKGAPAVNYAAAKENYDRGAIALSGEFIYQLVQSKPGENFVTSATSILIPLAQLALFAQNVVLTQLLAVLNLKSKAEIKSVYLRETPSYKNQEKVEFNIATKNYFNKNYPLSKGFQCTMRKYFNATAQNIDFSQNVPAADTINGYVANVTHNRIQNLVSPESLDSSTRAVIVNAIYFMGNWVHQFNPNDTQKRNFTKYNNDVVQLDTMYQENTFKYTENSNLRIQALEMPYKNDNFSFLVILPKNGAFDYAVSALRDPDNFLSIRNSLSYQKVQVYLPKMLINTAMDMAEMLKKDNVTDMFEPNSDGFKGILKNNEPLYISSAVQKTFLKVYETGTEAAAATAITVGVTSVIFPTPKVYVFNANRCFTTHIMFRGTPMFSGAFVGAK